MIFERDETFEGKCRMCGKTYTYLSEEEADENICPSCKSYAEFLTHYRKLAEGDPSTVLDATMKVFKSDSELAMKIALDIIRSADKKRKKEAIKKIEEHFFKK